MIVSQLPPSPWFGNIATSIHTKQGNCFVSTARHPLWWSFWALAFYDGDPGVDKQCKRIFDFSYGSKLKKDDIHKIHRGICDELNAQMESGTGVRDAIYSVVDTPVRHGVLIPSPATSSF